MGSKTWISRISRRPCPFSTVLAVLPGGGKSPVVGAGESLPEFRLVVLDGHDEVGPLVFDCEAGMLALGVHGVGGDGEAGDVEGAEKLPEGGDFVGLFADQELGEDDAFEMEEGGKEVDRLHGLGGQPARVLPSTARAAGESPRDRIQFRRARSSARSPIVRMTRWRVVQLGGTKHWREGDSWHPRRWRSSWDRVRAHSPTPLACSAPEKIAAMMILRIEIREWRRP